MTSYAPHPRDVDGPELDVSEEDARSIGDIFLRTAAESGARVAIRDAHRALTYAEAAQLVERGAQYLLDVGVQPGDRVAVISNRSVDTVLTFLSILVAGAAYAPINPADPDEWVSELLRGLEPVAIVTNDTTRAERLTTQSCKTIVPLTTALYDTALLDHRPLPALDGSALAYVMHTSGSTGRPKGVLVPHRGVVRLVCSAGEWLPVESSDVVVHAAALEFDGSTLEIYAALLNGGCLVVVDTETLVIPQRLGSQLTRSGATGMFLTTPLFHQLVQEDPEIFSGLRWLCVGGDTLAERQAQRFRRDCPDTRLLNVYGPTENSVITTAYQVGRVYGPIPIGQPIPGTTVEILDEELRPVLQGEVGELLVGGLGVADGYLGNPDETTRRFVTYNGTRHYRTGDLVHADLDGNLHFHGRADHQVKVRGRRIEVSRVVAALRDTDGVRDAYVKVSAVATGKRLDAYVVLDGTSIDQVRAHLGASYPAYMCPEHFVELSALPLKSNGKVDESRLHLPASAEIGQDVPSTTNTDPNLSPQQLSLARIWSALLHVKVEEITPDSDFFALGGSSITAGALVGRVAKDLQVGVKLAHIFERRTLSGIASTLSNGGQETSPLKRTQHKGLLHPQQRGMVALWYSDPNSVSYNIPVRIDIPRSYTVEQIRAALTQIVAKHDAFRIAFKIGQDGSGHEMSQMDTGLVRLDFETMEEPTSAVTSDDQIVSRFVQPFDLEAGPLLRALIVSDPNTRRLYLDTHHAVFDGVSLSLLLEDVFAELDGRSLRPTGLPYTIAAEQLAADLSEGSDNTNRAWWYNRFAERPETKDLPSPFRRAGIRSKDGSVAGRLLDGTLRQNVRESALKHRVTESTVLIAAYAASVARIVGPAQMVIGTLSSGRDLVDTISTIGMFVNTIPLRFEVVANTSLEELVTAIGQEQREALAHQNYSFEQLISDLGGQRDRSRTPLFDAFVAIHDLGFSGSSRRTTSAKAKVLHTGTTRFDLNMQIYLRDEIVELDLEFSSALFTPSTAETLLSLYEESLSDILSRSDSQVLGVSPRASQPYVPPASPDFNF